MTERRISVKPLRVVLYELHCAVPGCAGLMECFRSVTFTSSLGATRADHRCSMCGITETLDESYPRREYIEA